MQTEHQIFFLDSSKMEILPEESVNLVVTSPPYPMIEMWDHLFSQQHPGIKKRLKNGDGPGAFELMHTVLDVIWREIYRVLKPGGFACINIGDASRTIDGDFSLYTNHARMLTSLQNIGFSSLPCILWRKQTNAPNKFMGSGMLPAGAYVTLEHEYVLIVRKGSKRVFQKPEDLANRRASAIFWEERNHWFSDVWVDIKGSSQRMKTKGSRERSAAYPFELVHRLINMYSVKGDLVLDPFLGSGTTMLAAMASARNSIGYEIDSDFMDIIFDRVEEIIGESKRVINNRLVRHFEFIEARMKEKGRLKHVNRPYGFPVMTRQEKELLINQPASVSKGSNCNFIVEYDSAPQPDFCRDWTSVFEKKNDGVVDDPKTRTEKACYKQKTLF